MIFQIRDGALHEIGMGEMDPAVETVAFLTVPELEELYPYRSYAPRHLEECRAHPVGLGSRIEVYDSYDYCYINALDVGGFSATADCMALFLERNLFVVVVIADADRGMQRRFESVVADNVRMVSSELILYTMLFEFIRGTNHTIRDIEGEVHGLERMVVDGSVAGEVNRKSLDLKERLYTALSYYEELQDISEAMEGNANRIFDSDDVCYLGIFSSRTGRLCEKVQHLDARLDHLESAYDAAVNLQMNKTMQLFTVISTIFLPLTLVTGWYGMNFDNMPELHSEGGYFVVIGVCLTIVVALLAYFRRRRWL